MNTSSQPEETSKSVMKSHTVSSSEGMVNNSPKGMANSSTHEPTITVRSMASSTAGGVHKVAPTPAGSTLKTAGSTPTPAGSTPTHAGSTPTPKTTMIHHRATLREVAEAAGVSLKTASNVINGNGRMADATRERVEQVIKDLNYQVNVAARNLNRNQTGFITLAVPSLTPPYLAELANRVIDSARLRNYSVYVMTYAEGSANGMIEVLDSFNPTISDGLILSMSEIENIDAVQLERSYPIVTLGSRNNWGKTDHVMIDDVASAKLAINFLFDHGAKRIAVIGAREPFNEAQVRQASEGNAPMRLRGLLEAHVERGLTVNPRLIPVLGQDWTIGAGAKAATALLGSGERFDAVLACNDQLAIGAISRLAEAGLRIAQDVQIIGFDNIEEAAYLQIPLTTVDSKLDWIAPTAVSCIINRIRERISGAPSSPKRIVTASRVIERATTRKAAV